MQIANRESFAVASRRRMVEVEYLESTGTQWIDTGIYPGNTTQTNISFMLRGNTASTSYDCVAACEGNSVFYWISARGGNGSRDQYLLNTSNSGATVVTRTLNVRHYVSFNAVGNKAIVDGVSYSLGSVANTCSTTLTLWGEHLYSNVSYRSIARIYSVVITDRSTGTVLRNMTPVRVGDAGYMYDHVSGRLFGNGGTGNFVLGPDKATRLPHEVLQYVEFVSCGLQVRADTTYIPAADSEIECGFSCQDNKGVAYTGPFASDTVDSSTELTRILFDGAVYDRLMPCWRNTAATGKVLSVGAAAGQYIQARIGSDRRCVSNGAFVELNSASGTVSSPPSVKIICGYPSSVTEGVRWRIYFWRARAGGVATRDIVPVRMKGSGAIRFYDTVRNSYLELTIGGYDIPSQCINAVGSVVPQYTSAVEWLGADGASFFDLGFAPTNQIRLSLDAYRAANTVRWDCGAQESWSANIARLIVQESASCYWQYGKSASQKNVAGSTNLVGKLSLSVNGPNYVVQRIGGTRYAGSTTSSAAFTAPANFALCAVGTSPNTAAVAASGGVRFLGGVIADAGAGVTMGLQPVRIGGIGALYDRVSNRLIYTGRGSFAAGPDIGG